MTKDNELFRSAEVRKSYAHEILPELPGVGYPLQHSWAAQTVI
jgi:hypothetical protein